MNPTYRREWLTFFSVLLAIGLGMGILAFSQSPRILVEKPIPYHHQAIFAYTAPAPKNLYDQPQVLPGEPILTRITPEFQISADYRFVTNLTTNIKGTYQWFARVEDETGWQRTLPLTEPVPFEGTTMHAETKVPLNKLASFIQRFEEVTDLQRVNYQLSVWLQIRLTGDIGGQQIQPVLKPGLLFLWNTLNGLLIVHRPSASPLQANEEEKEGSPFTWVQKGIIIQKSWQPNTLHLLGVSLPVRETRWGAGLLTIFALAGLLWTFFFIPMTEQDIALAVLQEEDTTLIPVESFPAVTNAPIKVLDAPTLARLAHTYRRPILSTTKEANIFFRLYAPDFVYEYHTSANDTNTSESSHHTPTDWKGLLTAWARVTDAHTIGDEKHSQRVAQLATHIGERYNLPTEGLQSLYLAALLHGLGLAELPSTLLHTTTPLSPEERTQLQSHVKHLYTRFHDIAALSQPLAWAISAYERWDGSGYPEGLIAKDIPLESRILAIADVWDALTHPRPWRDAWSEKDAEQWLERQAGVLFDPETIAALWSTLHETPFQEAE